MDRIAGGNDGKDHALRLGRTPPFPNLAFACSCTLLAESSVRDSDRYVPHLP